MLQFREATDVDLRLWDQYVARSVNGNLRQTTYWGSIKQTTGWMPHYYVVEKNGEISAAALIQERRIPLVSRPLLYCCRGPIVDWTNTGTCEALLMGFKKVLREKRGLVLRIDPEPVRVSAVQEQLLSASHFKKIPDRCTSWNRTLYTTRVSLDLEEDALFMRMRRTLRQNIKKAMREGVTATHEVEPDDPEQFAKLMQGLEAKRNSVVHRAKYHEQICREFVESGVGYLLKAKHNGENISALIVVVLGDKAWAVFMANDYSHRHLMPNKVLLWEAIRLSKRLGCRFLDLGATQGSPGFDPINDPLDNLKGAYCPEIVDFPGYFDLPGRFYALSRVAEARLLPIMHRSYVRIQRAVKLSFQGSAS